MPVSTRFVGKRPLLHNSQFSIHNSQFKTGATPRLPVSTRFVGKRAFPSRRVYGETTTVIETLHQAAQQSHAPATSLKLQQIANYFERNLPYMAYDDCLRQGWPIASGVIEGACRHIVKDRMELSGMRWSQNGAEQLLRLRCVHDNGHWDTFWEYRRAQRLQPNSANRDCSSLPLVA